MSKPGSNESGLVPASTQQGYSGAHATPPAPDKEEGGAVNPLDLVRDRLEGRWIYAISSSIVLAILAAIVAWNVAPVTYQAEGWLKGNSRNEIIVEQITETGETKDFTPFLESQALLIKSSGVVDHALNSPALQPLTLERSRDAMIHQLEYNLYADVHNNTELIVVSFIDKDPAATASVANAIMNSYITLHGSQGDERLNMKKQQLRRFKQENRQSAENRRKQQQALLRRSKYGIAEIGSLASENANVMVALESQKKLVDETMAKLQKKAMEEGREITGKEIDEPTLTALETFNPRLAILKTDIQKIQIEYDQLRSRLSEDHRSLRILDSTLKSMKDNLVIRIDETKERWYEGPGKDQSYDKLEELLQKIGTQMSEKREEIDEMNALRDDFAALDREIT